MQLKMSKQFNVKVIRQRLQEENKYISDIFSKLELPISQTSNDDEDIENTENPIIRGEVFPASVGKVKRAQTFEELHAKLDELKNVKKLAYKQKLQKKSLKNKLKKKAKKDERLMQKKLVRAEQMASSLSKPNQKDGEVSKVPKPKPVFNSEGHMVFSKFDFSEIGTKKKPPKTEKDPKKILQQLEHKKEKLKELEQAGDKDKVVEIKEKDAWRSALAKASGEKIKDDPELLKKTIKRQEQQKKHSSKKWENRKETLQKMKQDKQEKRTENILKRKKDKKLNKLKRAAKKGRVIPGF